MMMLRWCATTRTAPWILGFDGDGKVTTAIGAGDDYGRSVIQQADGKLVVAGHSSNGNNYDVALVRYDSQFVTNNIFRNGFE
jgi:hypothetical protein